MPIDVALIASSFHPNSGGVEEMVRQLAHAQQSAGASPVVVTNRWPKDLPAAESFEGIPVSRFVFRVPERSWKQLGGSLLYGPATLLRMCDRIRRQGSRILHVHCVSSNAYYAFWARRLTGLPLVVTLHAELTMDASRLFQRSEFAKRLMRRVLEQADYVTACSGRTLSDAVEFLGHPLKIGNRVIYNGTNLADADEAEPLTHHRPFLLAAGRLVPQKGIDVLLRAFALSITDFDLLIAGDGAERVALEILARELGISNRVFFLGRKDRKEMLSLFHSCTAFVLPSRSDEGLPMVLLETMAASKPSIAASVGGVPELVKDGQSGILVPRENIDAFKCAIEKISNNSLLRSELSLGARSRAEAFAWPNVVRQYEEVYTEVLTKRSSKTGQHLATNRA